MVQPGTGVRKTHHIKEYKECGQTIKIELAARNHRIKQTRQMHRKRITRPKVGYWEMRAKNKGSGDAPGTSWFCIEMDCALFPQVSPF